MSKHTPGPWFQVGYVVEVEDDNTPDICCCHPESVGQAHLKHDEETIVANARLIAAAPDLLDELMILVRLAEMSGVFKSDALQPARAIIARATG